MARDFTLYDASNFNEEESFWKLVELRWGSTEIITCPQCGVINKHYYRKGRRQWRCKDCDAYFSLTTRTPFQDRKLPFKKILMGMMDFIHCADGVSHHEFCRRFDIQVKTAQSFIGRLREACWNNRPQLKLSGVVHIDGGYFGGRPRHGRVRRRNDAQAVAKHVEDQLTKGKVKHKPRNKTALANWIRKLKNRRTVMVLRELYPEPGMGARRTIIAICASENELCATELASLYVEPGATIMTDENAAYNRLDIEYDHKTVQHAIEFSTEDGVSDNQAESYFSRMRRYVLGVSHRIEAKYMADIATEMAWREDVRKMTEGQKRDVLLKAVFNSGLSRWWRGYWQGYHRSGELLFGPAPA